MATRTEQVKVLLAGISGLILMLGIARFAYTPLLPLMLEQSGLSAAQGSWLASINYLGYLSGALIASRISNMPLKDSLYRLGILVAVLSTAGMALTTDWRLWALLRYIAGLSSAAGMLLCSGLVLNWLIRNHFRGELGIHFTGVGLGIAGGALLVELLGDAFDWRQQWLWFSAAATLLAIPAWGWLPRPGATSVTVSGEALTDSPPSPLFLRLFLAAYFCAGTGYVVSATFIVAIVDAQPDLTGLGNRVFLLIGLAAIPASILWDRLARRLGVLNALILNYLLQILGISLPLLSTSLEAALLGALLFGGTFAGAVSLVLTMAGRYYPRHPAKMMGKMTLSYGVAQILAPGLIALMVTSDADYRQGLVLASAAMLVGSVLMVLLRGLEKHESGLHARTS
ncbi:YbfB/YjiJ family MFS transporter [Motiliproteus sp. SC1-56]|uniref:YbfB/YjiJ family MFS transporter n=1 Tax=Motiliproteus sp. SC1-56 TaxID=2799565 RepID=UPI001A8CF6C8|nr:YbfB/YjiJ family MFS transporter [Motiliproteus sp. SC1-56]